MEDYPYKPTRKMLESYLDKLESPATDCESPAGRFKSKEVSITNSDENPFSFSFNGKEKLSEATIRENKRKYQFGLNLLQCYFQRKVKATFKIIKHYTPVILEPKERLLKKIITKAKRKSLKHFYNQWRMNSIKVTSQTQINSALMMVNKVNSFSRQYIAFSILHSLFSKHFSIFAQKFLDNASNDLKASSKLPNFGINKSIEGLPKDFSLLPVEFRLKSFTNGYTRLITFFEKKQILNKKLSWTALSSPAFFLKQTDRYIELTEQIFQAKEAKEKAEFEKEELAALLESKNEELNSLLDMLEHQKSWESKLKNVEKETLEESKLLKNQLIKQQSEIEKINKELISCIEDKKRTEEECLRAYRLLESAQKQINDLQSKDEKKLNPIKEECETCSELETVKAELEEYKKKCGELEELSLSAYDQINSMQEEINKLKPKPKGATQKKTITKKSIDMEKPLGEQENQFAIEVVNLTRQLNKLKHESRAQGEALRKTTLERDELKKLIQGKNEALDRLRKENDQLCLCLSGDHYKSVHKLETQLSQTESKYKEISNELKIQCQKNGELQAEIEILKKNIS
ncbi:unnamed protein product [Blepharisma stoltei]|uniref:Uncharacterized protein n=1 Tax=Blepharisma stoltei TaxID=1481888 RepID=A0AAU9IIN8_9CILI|nr:unnamed protein product [Blepharisma stoltei]